MPPDAGSPEEVESVNHNESSTSGRGSDPRQTGGQLSRSRRDQILGGVCGGLSESFDVDANLIRLIFIVLAVIGGAGVWIYLLLWLFLPLEGEPREVTQSIRSGADEIVNRVRQLGRDARSSSSRRGRAPVLLGAALILLGAVLLLKNLGVWWTAWLRFDIWWPALVILAGVVMLFGLIRRR